MSSPGWIADSIPGFALPRVVCGGAAIRDSDLEGMSDAALGRREEFSYPGHVRGTPRHPGPRRRLVSISLQRRF